MQLIAHPPRGLASPAAAFTSLWAHRGLIYQLTKREVVGRYRGSVMGILWSFFNPVLMLAVYTFVFSVVFKARWGATESGRGEFALILFAGMIVYTLFSECVNRAPGLILGNANYVKKVVFPLEILPWVIMGSALFHALISLAVLFLFHAFVYGAPPWTALLLPAVLLPLVLLTLGLSWFLAATGVYLRDVGQTVTILTTVLMFLSPLFYPVEALPEDYRVWLHLNPLTFIMGQTRDVLIWGRTPDWGGLAAYAAGGLAVAWLGFAWFQRARRGFADVL